MYVGKRSNFAMDIWLLTQSTEYRLSYDWSVYWFERMSPVSVTMLKVKLMKKT